MGQHSDVIKSYPFKRLLWRLFGFKEKVKTSPLEKRRSKLSHIILLTFSVLCLILLCIYTIGIIKHPSDNGFGFLNFAILTVIVFSLYAFGKRVSYSKAITILAIILVSCVTYGAIMWGVTLPSILLSYIAIMGMVSSCLTAKYRILFAAIIGLVFTILGTREALFGISYPWIYEPLGLGDVIEYALLLTIAFTIVWFGGRFLEEACNEEYKLIKELEKYNNKLEQLVKERTDQLQESQAKQLESVHRLGEFGRLASGLLHDLISPLTSLSLTISKENTITPIIDRATTSAKKIDESLAAIRSQLKHEDTESFILTEAIAQTLKLLEHRTKQLQVFISAAKVEPLHIQGNLFDFQGIVLNLVNNALDAVSQAERKEIKIYTERENDNILIHIEDTGPGIDPRIQKTLFTPHVTTKIDGCGLGLFLVQKRMTEQFHGYVTYTTNTQGTTFTLHLPISQLVPPPQI